MKYHVDDLMGSHVDPKVNDEFLKWLNEMYGHFGEVKATRGPIHDYLGMTFDFLEKGIVKIDLGRSGTTWFCSPPTTKN